MKTCPHCHASNRDEARFCSACGARLESPAAESTPPIVEAPAAEAQVPPLAEPVVGLPAMEEAPTTGEQPEPGLVSSTAPSPAATAFVLACPACGCTIRYCPCCGAPLETLQA